MSKPAAKNGNRIIHILMTALTVVLIVLFFNILSLVVDIQGTARVVNYAGLVRGTTQRIVKLEDAGQPQDKLLEAVDSYINGLRFGSDELNLVSLNDDEYQAKMTELAAYFSTLRDEINRVRDVGYENTDIIAKSEEFFDICDTTTKLAEEYSQERATALNQLENVVFAVIAGLIALMAIELARAIRTAAQNRALQKKVYLDEATGLPNKNKCEEILRQETPTSPDAPVAMCMFDLNNLRTINNNLGHEAGDAYIRSFAEQLAKIAGPACFVGRDGGDEFIAMMQNASHADVEAQLAKLRALCAEYSQANPAMPISYAAGWALSSDFGTPTLRELLREADKNMYIDKNRAKRAEATEMQQHDRLTLKRIESMGYRFSDCLYCDALLDQYRVLRASSDAFLADSGNYTGAAVQIAAELAADSDRTRLRELLQLEHLRQTLGEQTPTLTAPYHLNTHRGRLTVVFLDGESGALHHFVVGFEPFHSIESTEKQQLSRYYDQMKQSFMENAHYVDALLESAQTAYSVNLTDDELERAFTQPSEERFDLGIEPPCSYDAYCRRRSKLITDDTVESYRLIDTSEKLLKRFEAGASEVTIEYRERTKGGQTMWLQKSVLMSRDTAYDAETQRDRPVVRGIILLKNTSAFHQHEEEEKQRLEQALETVDSENKAKTEFMNRMSHDFRTPINGILGMLEIIRMSNQDPEKTRECLEKIQLSANHLFDLVNDVLDMSKLSSGQMVLEQVRFDLEALMADVRSLVDAQLQESNIAHRSYHVNIRHAHLIGSDLRLRQIMLNLFSNAIKYNKPGGSVNTYATELGCTGGVARFEFKIEDTGIGMSQQFMDQQLFKPFTQEELGARTHYRGTGLGMSIVKSLVDALGGTIDVQSQQGVGTTITFWLTFTIDDAGEAQGPGSDKAQDMASLEGKRVLLVEDNDLNMEIAEYYLDAAGAVVMKAWNGKEAVTAFEKSAPGSISLVLMDLMMPVMDGLEATRAIRALDRADAASVPIIAMTANAFDEDRECTKAAGMNAHLSKPLDMRALIDAVKRYGR